MESSAKPTLGYWGIRGLGQYCRLTIEAAGVTDYNHIKYVTGDDWFAQDKPQSPVLLPNLPYYIFGDIAISETDSICRTIARVHKADLLGKTSKDQAFVEYIFSFVMKFNSKVRDLCYIETTEEQRKKIFDDNKARLEAINTHLGTHKFFAGDYLTIADIGFYETMQCAKLVHEASYKAYPNFEKHEKAFEEEAWFKNYKASDRFIASPINAPSAKINNI